MATPTPYTLTALPTELLLTILFHLNVKDLTILRRVARIFITLVPNLTLDDLLEAEQESWAMGEKLVACSKCVRLRKEEEFSRRMVWHSKMRRGGRNAGRRWCNDCLEKESGIEVVRGCHG